ncbi:MAG: ABC transporter transmembrane domain-containing protein [Deltaproteobacteria bacterium]|nr:ABC transporter transmembrane domain-containing protein [Deltaproteobacteria bacterium]
MGLARPQRKRLAIATVFLIVGSAASLAFPQGVRRVIDEALAGASPGALNRAAIMMAVVSLVFGLSIACRYVLFTVAGERVVVDLRAKLYRAILNQEVAFFDARRTGELTSRLASDTQVLQNAVSVNLSMALRSGAQAVGAIALLLYTSPILSAIMLSVVPAVAMGAVIYGRRVRRLARDVQDALASAGEIAEESIGGLRTVRAFAAEDIEGARYQSAVERSFEFARKRIIAGGTFMAVASFSAYASAVLVFWYGGRLVARGDMSIGGLTSFLMYTLIVAFALGGLADLWADFMRAAGAAERVFDLLDREPAMSLTGGATLPHVQGHVELQDVTFAYPTRADVPVLEGLTLQLLPGEVVAVVGPSGAGKSTVAALITRFYDPQSGSLKLDEHDLRQLDARWLRSQIGVVAQEPVLFSTSIAENIRYGKPGASEAEVQDAARAANAHDFVLRFPQGYQTPVGERGVQLSGGQKQRIAIARALLKNPRVLILDEATSALDAESEHLVQEALERLMQGRTTLIIAHRLSTVMRADRVVVLSGGRVAQSGSHASLVKEEGLYRRLVERQFALDVA